MTKTIRIISCVIFLFFACITAIAQPGRITPPKKPQTTKQSIKPVITTTGTLSITSTPSDASVKIDGRYLGTTPLTLEKQKAGTYKISFSAEGYDTQTKSVTVMAGKTATCSAALKKKQAQQPLVQQSVQQPTITNSTSSSSQTITANGVSFKMIRVEGQGNSFYIGETEVTQALWEAIMGNNPSKFKGTNRPVENVSWNDCKEFISRLNSATDKTFRLPKEKEWEYAAKGGKKSHGYEYSGSNEVKDVAWYDSNACDGVGSNSPDYGSHNVKTKKANELGIYDMSGNVWEWCEDLYSSSSSSRVSRGGSWLSYAGDCRVSYRRGSAPGDRNYYLGLRLVL